MVRFLLDNTSSNAQCPSFNHLSHSDRIDEPGNSLQRNLLRTISFFFWNEPAHEEMAKELHSYSRSCCWNECFFWFTDNHRCFYIHAIIHKYDICSHINQYERLLLFLRLHLKYCNKYYLPLFTGIRIRTDTSTGEL